MSGPVRAGALSVLLLGTVACNPFALPGLGALPTPPADTIEPEPLACGALRERPVVTVDTTAIPGVAPRPIIGAADSQPSIRDLASAVDALGLDPPRHGMSHALSKAAPKAWHR